MVELQNKEVGVLIITDCADVFSILEVRESTNQEPIAWKTAYEWCLLGQSGSGHDGTMFNAFINAKKSDDAVHEKLEQHFRQDFPKEDNLSVRCDKKLGGGSEKEFYTRRDVLSAVMGIFDPLGQVSPFVLKGKKLNQRLCMMKYDWDERLPLDIQDEF